MRPGSGRRPTRRQVITLAVYALVLIGIVGGRGWSLENVARATLLGYFGPFATPVWTLGRFWGWVWSGLDVRRHRPGERIRALTSRPLLLIHGTADRLVPHTETLRLYELAGGRAELWLVPGAHHVQSLDHPEYRERLRRFFEGGTR